MNIKEELERLQSTALTAENAHYFLEKIPDLKYATDQRLEQALDKRDMQKLFNETMAGGIIRSYKENNPKATEKLLDSVVAEELHEERLKLAEYESNVRKWEITASFLKEKLWSAKSIYAKTGEQA